MNNYEKFCEYFHDLDELGIPYGLTDLFRKANELELEPQKEFTDDG